MTTTTRMVTTLPLVGRWTTIEGARRAGRRDARNGRPLRDGIVCWPGTYVDAYRTECRKIAVEKAEPRASI